MDFLSEEYLSHVVHDHLQAATASGIDHMSYSSFMADWERVIADCSRKLANGTYEFTRYREVLILKDRHSLPRCISIPTIRDRVVLEAMLDWIQSLYESKPDISTPKMPQQIVSDIEATLNRSARYTAFIKLDIRHFFDSINHYRLFKQLEELPDVLALLVKKSIQTPTAPETESSTAGVPQGLPISNIVSQIYMNDLVELVEKKYPHVSVVRYVDDVIILCRIKDIDIIQRFFTALMREEFTLEVNPAKIKSGRLRNNDFEFLGYRFLLKSSSRKTLLSVRKSSIDKVRERLLRVMTHYKKQNNSGKGLNVDALIFELNIIISGSVVTKTRQVDGDLIAYKKRYGWLFFFSQITDYSVLYMLDSFVSKKMRRIFPNLSSDTHKKINSFVATLRDIRFKLQSSSNVFYPDKLNVDQKLSMLRRIFNMHLDDQPSDDEINDLFDRKLYRMLAKNEQDLVNGYS